MNTMTQDTSTGLWNSKNRKIFFWSILALAMILRCIRFATVPDGINQDEAMGAVEKCPGIIKIRNRQIWYFSAGSFYCLEIQSDERSPCLLHGPLYQTVRIQHGNGASADGTDLLWRGGIGISCGQEIIL